MKNYNDTDGDRTRGIPTCSAVRNFIVYHANYEGKVSFIAYFSDCVLVNLSNDGRMQQPKHVSEK